MSTCKLQLNVTKNPICFFWSLFMYHIIFFKLFLPVSFILCVDYCPDTIPQIYLFIIDLQKIAVFLISMIHCSTPKNLHIILKPTSNKTMTLCRRIDINTLTHNPKTCMEMVCFNHQVSHLSKDSNQKFNMISALHYLILPFSSTLVATSRCQMASHVAIIWRSLLCGHHVTMCICSRPTAPNVVCTPTTHPNREHGTSVPGSNS